MAPTVELLFAHVSAVHHDDPSHVKAILDVVAETNCKGIYYGTTIEDSNLLVLIDVWDKIEDHWALREDKTRFGKIQETFAKISDGSPPEVFHVHFEPEENLAALLNAPTTSFTRIIERKPGKTAEDLEGTLKAIARLLLPSDNLKSTYGGAWGKLVERDEHVLMAGWGSKDDHMAFGKNFAQDEATASIAAQLTGATEKAKRGHVHLTAFKKYAP